MDSNEIPDYVGCKLIRVRRIIHFWLLNDMHFVWLDSLTMLRKNTINIFEVSSNIILYYFLFSKYLKISKISLLSIGLKSTEKSFYASF